MATKRRVEINPTNISVSVKPPGVAQFAPVPPPVTVVAEKPGQVTKLDKAKAYYHSLIVLLGSLLVAANQALPLLHGDLKTWVSGAIAVMTIAATALKSNEIWVSGL